MFDIEKDPLDLSLDLLPENHVDIVFLLSVCRWINNWEEVIDFCTVISKAMLFESNGPENLQKNQLTKLERSYINVQKLSDSSDDDPRIKKRRLYLCTND